MASKSKKQAAAFVPSQNAFTKTLFKIGYRFSLPRVFDDFLTMSIAACTQNIATHLSYYEAEYLETIGYYKDSELRHEFPNAFAYLIEAMEAQVGAQSGNDILGDFFEQHISHGHNGQFFTPPAICQLMASILHTGNTNEEAMAERKPLRILDPACGSGRMLLAAQKVYGTGHEYYGIDIDRICVKMTALNLFLNGIWNSEVMCANALISTDFVIAYHISFIPLGIFKIEEKEKSILWQSRQHSFLIKEANADSISSTEDKTPSSEKKQTDASQLRLF